MTPNDLEWPLAKKPQGMLEEESAEYQSRHVKGHIALLQDLPKLHFFQFRGALEANMQVLEGPIILSIRMRVLMWYYDLEITFNDRIVILDPENGIKDGSHM